MSKEQIDLVLRTERGLALIYESSVSLGCALCSLASLARVKYDTPSGKLDQPRASVRFTVNTGQALYMGPKLGVNRPTSLAEIPKR